MNFKIQISNFFFSYPFLSNQTNSQLITQTSFGYQNNCKKSKENKSQISNLTLFTIFISQTHTRKLNCLANRNRLDYHDHGGPTLFYRYKQQKISVNEKEHILD